MKAFKKRLLPMLLALAMSLSLLPVTARADDTVREVYDVYQGDGFYITATPFKINSNKYTMGNSTDHILDGRFHDGMYMVSTSRDCDENYVNREFINEFNFVDKNGNVLFPEGIFHYDWHIVNYGTKGDLSPSEGLIPYWDGESKDGGEILMGFVDYNGREVIPCQYRVSSVSPFHEGLANVETAGRDKREGFIDKSGSFVPELSSFQGSGDAFFSDGLVLCVERDYYGSGIWTYGYMDKSGNMVLKLCSYNPNETRGMGMNYWEMYAEGKMDGYLMPLIGRQSAFSDGYAVCYDLRSGNEKDYNFAIINKAGSVVGTFSGAKPEGGVASGGFHDGLLRVRFIDNRDNTAGYGFVDTSGNFVIREKNTANPTVDWSSRSNIYDYSCGLLAFGLFVVDTKGNIVIPRGAFTDIKKFDSNLSMAYLDTNLNPSHTPSCFSRT